MTPLEVPAPTIARLALYLRCLRACRREGIHTISSAGIGERIGISSGQVRKDLSYFGEFGKPGTGYAVEGLLEHLSEIMRLDRPHDVVLVGAGNLGRALVGYPGFAESGFRVVAVYENNPAKIGQTIGELPVPILDVAALVESSRQMRAEFGIIATPASAAQEVADALVKAGVRGILNFAPTHISVPDTVTSRNVDLTRELEVLCYFVGP
jgi:redox-sensing transcriptional repressor